VTMVWPETLFVTIVCGPVAGLPGCVDGAFGFGCAPDGGLAGVA
jgi:hypothetical protein